MGRMFPDKQGRLIDIDTHSGAYKISPRERDEIYQAFLKQFPNRNLRSRQAREWMKLKAQDLPITAGRIRDFIDEGVEAEKGNLNPAERWGWWVGCSLMGNSSTSE